MLAVSQSLFGVGLYQARSECQCFLSILDFDGLLGFLSNFVQSGLDDFKVQIDQLFEAARSEEHTSELQSLMRISYAVFCLKKKKKQRQKETQPIEYKRIIIL